MTHSSLEMFALEGKVAAVTGGGGALCGAMAVALGSMGVKIAILDKHLANARKREKTISDAGGVAMHVDNAGGRGRNGCAHRTTEQKEPQN